MKICRLIIEFNVGVCLKNDFVCKLCFMMYIVVGNCGGRGEWVDFSWCEEYDFYFFK